MNDLELARRLRRLRRTVLMLETELRNGTLDEELLSDVDLQLEQGIATDPRSTYLRELVDALRESTLTASSDHYRNAIRACEKLKDAMEEVVGMLN